MPHVRDAPYHLQFLRETLKHRQSKNRSFSLRAFARQLGIDPSALSRIMSGKQMLSLKVCTTIVRKLGLATDEKRAFLASVVRENDRMIREKLGTVGESVSSLRLRPVELDAATFDQISDIRCLALLEIPYLDGGKSDPAWVARQVGWSTEQAREGLATLIRLGLLKEAGGRLEKTSRHMTTADKQKTTEALRRQQKQILREADRALEVVPLSARSMTGMVMAVDPDRIEEAKGMIQQFMEELCDFLESGKRTMIYQLGVQLFPLAPVAEVPADAGKAGQNEREEVEV